MTIHDIPSLVTRLRAEFFPRNIEVLFEEHRELDDFAVRLSNPDNDDDGTCWLSLRGYTIEEVIDFVSWSLDLGKQKVDNPERLFSLVCGDDKSKNRRVANTET
jgi:hypothetical protein